MRRQPLWQRAAGKILDGEDRDVAPDLEAVDRRQRIVTVRRHRPGFGLQLRDRRRAHRRQRLERDVSIETHVAGEVDHTHAAGAEPPAHDERRADAGWQRGQHRESAARAGQRRGRLNQSALGTFERAFIDGTNWAGADRPRLSRIAVFRLRLRGAPRR